MEPAQLDIFADSRETMLRNDVLRALEGHDAAGAQQALLVFRAEYPDDAGFEPLQRLTDYASREPGARFSSHADLQHACAEVSHLIEPAARLVFNADAADRWIAPSWSELARRASVLPFDPAFVDGHAAPLWLRAGEFASAETAAGGIESWRRIPAPLSWMAQARVRVSGLDAAWPLLAELAWLAPERFGECAAQLRDPVLDRLLKRFVAEFDADGTPVDLVWFPAWSLVHDNLLGAPLGLAQAGLHSRAERTFRAVLGLLVLERRGAHRELIEARRAFCDLHDGLYATYIKTR